MPSTPPTHLGALTAALRSSPGPSVWQQSPTSPQGGRRVSSPLFPCPPGSPVLWMVQPAHSLPRQPWSPGSSLSESIRQGHPPTGQERLRPALTYSRAPLLGTSWEIANNTPPTHVGPRRASAQGKKKPFVSEFQTNAARSLLQYLSYNKLEQKSNRAI